MIYASWKGSSRDIALYICSILKKHGFSVRCQDVHEKPDLSDYDSVIIGGGIRGGCYHPKLIQFLKKHENELSQMPVAYFIVCMTMRQNNETSRCTASEYIDTLQKKTPHVKPVSVGLFGGMMNYSDFSKIMQWFVRRMHLPDGDFRNWDAVERWALQTAPVLVKKQSL